MCFPNRLLVDQRARAGACMRARVRMRSRMPSKLRAIFNRRRRPKLSRHFARAGGNCFSRPNAGENYIGAKNARFENYTTHVQEGKQNTQKHSHSAPVVLRLIHILSLRHRLTHTLTDSHSSSFILRRTSFILSCPTIFRSYHFQTRPY